MFRYVIILILVLLLFKPVLCEAETQNNNYHFLQEIQSYKRNFKITLSLDRNYFYEGEPVILKMVINNLSERPDSIAYLEETIMRNLSACNYRQFMGDIIYGEVPYTFFAPGDSIIRTYEINYSLNAKSEITHMKSGVCNAHINLPLNDSAKTIVSSNSLRFFIFEPLKNDILYDKLMPFLKKNNYDDNIKILDDFDRNINEYLYSRYFDAVFYFVLNLKGIMEYKLDSSLVNTAMQQIRRNPESSVSGYGLSFIYRILGKTNDSEKLKEIEKEITDNYKSARIYLSMLEYRNYYK